MSGQRSAVVLVVSTSAAAGAAADTTGPVIAQWLRERGFDTTDPQICADGDAVSVALRGALAHRPEVILTTGGTGVAPDDVTPEQTAPFLQVQLPGLAEELRRRGTAHTPMAVITRAAAGFAGDTFIMNLPGSPGGVADGLAVLDDVLLHLLAQRSGTGRSNRTAHDNR